MTDFEKKVLEVVSKIPLGQLRSYKWVARKAGRPRAYRAVANALAKNPYPLFIPCHRVIKSSPPKAGSRRPHRPRSEASKAAEKELGGYSLGRGLKEKLINLEKKIRDMIE